MPFIGTQPDVGGYSVLDALTASATASYTLQLNSANFVPSSANQLLVSLNGVIQKPGTSFTVSGSTLTFSSALTSSDSIDFILAMGEPLLVGTPSDGTITTNKLVNDSVTGAKIENNPTIAGNLTVSGNTAASGTLTSTGLITASAGVAIGGTGAANTLDDYEEGTFTPSITFNNASAGITYGTRNGTYIKIGRMVYVSIAIRLTSKGSSTGSASVAGLPFTVSNGGGYEDPAVSLAYLRQMSNSNFMTAACSHNSTYIELDYPTTASSHQVNNTDFTNSSAFNVSGSYYIA